MQNSPKAGLKHLHAEVTWSTMQIEHASTQIKWQVCLKFMHKNEILMSWCRIYAFKVHHLGVKVIEIVEGNMLGMYQVRQLIVPVAFNIYRT